MLGPADQGLGPMTGNVPLVRSPQEVLSAIRADIGDCTRCKLHTLGRTQVVFGVGNPDADLMFVGEAPGRDEDMQGIPFVGRAGQKLTQIIEAIGLTREQVYIANVIKCRPPGNRNPEPDEVATCEPFLMQQIDAIAPKVIVALGSFAAKSLLKTDDPISRLRGRVYYVPWRPAHPHISPRVPAAQSGVPARCVGRHEEGASDSERRRRPGLTARADSVWPASSRSRFRSPASTS